MSAISINRPLWRVSWRRMKRRPLQYLLLVLGVALGVAMVVSIDIANSSASRAFSLSTEAVVGRATHRIVGGPGGLKETIYTQLKTSLGFDLAAPVVEGYVTSEELGERPLRFIGIDPFAEGPFREYFADLDTPGSEGLASFLTSPNGVVLPIELADSFGLKPGDQIRLQYVGVRIPALVSSVLVSQSDSERLSISDLVFADISFVQESLNMVGRLSHIDLIVEDDADLGVISAMLPPGVRLEAAAARGNALQQMSRAFEVNLTALSLLALIVGMFLIYNTVTFSVVQRRPLFGILRCLGATGDQLLVLILVEVIALSLAGSVIGLLLGLILGRGMVGLVSQTINDFYFVVNVRETALSPWTLLKGLAVGVLAAGAAAVVPAWEAMQTVPESGLHRSQLESKARRMIGWLTLAFFLTGTLGLMLLIIRPGDLIISFAGLFVILIACAFLAPGLTLGFMNIITPITARLLGAVGRMAPRNIGRSLSRTSVAVAALMIAVSVIIGVSIMINSFRLTVDQWLGDTLQADIYLSPPNLTGNRIVGSLDQEVINAARNWPGVSWSVTAWRSEVFAPNLGRPVEVVAVDGDISDGNRRYVWLDGEQADVWRGMREGRGVLLSEPLLIRENLGERPQNILLQTDSGPHEFPVLGVFYDYSSDQGTVLIDQGYYQQWWEPLPATSLGLFVEPGFDVESLAAELQLAFQDRQNIVVQTNRLVRANALDIFDRTFAITAALQLLAVIVAFIGVLSALMSLQLERTRELGIIRAAGMTVSQLWRLILLETGLMGFTAGLLAVPVGWILAFVLIYVINRRSFGWTLDMNLEPTAFLQAFVIALIAALLAGLYPAARSGQMVVADAIREE